MVRTSTMAMAMKIRPSVMAATVTWLATAQLTSGDEMTGAVCYRGVHPV